MKNSWLVWLFVVGVILTVFIAFNYQGDRQSKPLTDIFPDEYSSPVDVEYEFVDQEVVVVKNEEDVLPKESVVPPVMPMEKTSVDPARASSKAVTIPEVTPPKQAQVEPTRSSSTVKAGFTIQVASFKEKTMADKLAEELKKKNFLASVVSKNLGDKGTWFRVNVGQYESKSQAEANLGPVKALHPNSFIVVLSK
jgi:cell division septation protein DedD